MISAVVMTPTWIVSRGRICGVIHDVSPDGGDYVWRTYGASRESGREADKETAVAKVMDAARGMT